MNEYNKIARDLSVAYYINQDSAGLVQDQVKEFDLELQKIDEQLTKCLTRNTSIINNLLRFGSLPIAGRYELVEINTAHTAVVGKLRVLLDDIAEASKMDLIHSHQPQFTALKLKAMGMLFNATQMQMLLESGITGKPLPHINDVCFNFSYYLDA